MNKFTTATLLCIFLCAFYYFTFIKPIVSEKELYHIHLKLFAYYQEHKILSILIFIFIYIAYAILSLPGIFLLSLFAGYLFGQPYSTFYVVLAATIGATALFLLLKTSFNNLISKKAIPFLSELETGFNRNAASYLLFLRWIPLFPFAIVNIAAAIFKVPLFTFFWTTIIGMIPSVYVYTKAGIGFNKLMDSPTPISPIHFLNSDLIFASIGLCALALLPIFMKKFSQKWF